MRHSPLRKGRLPRQTMQSSPLALGQGPGEFAYERIDQLRQALRQARQRGLLEAEVAERLGRIFGPAGRKLAGSTGRLARSLSRAAYAALRPEGALAFVRKYSKEMTAALASVRPQGLIDAEIPQRMGRVFGPGRFVPAAKQLSDLAQRLGQSDAALRALAVAVVLAAAVALRVIDLGRVGFNSDEAVYSGQGAALFGDATMREFFSVFRAHPLLLQVLLGGLFSIVGISDLAARLLVGITFGAGSVLVTYLLATRLYGHRVGIAAAVIMAVLPYHVLVSRQVLVDTPLAFFVLLALWFLALSTDDTKGRWLILTGLAAGLAVASKEVGFLLLPIIAAFLLNTGRWRQLPLQPLMVGFALFVIVVAPFPISRLFFSNESGSSFFLWQLSRSPNHEATYFLQVLIEFGGILFLALALLGLLRMATRPRSDGDTLILLWLAIFLGFLQIWPTKLFFYLIVVVPALSICAALGLDTAASWVGSAGSTIRSARRTAAKALLPLALVAMAIYFGTGSLSMILNGPEAVTGQVQLDIEVQDFAGGREFGQWAKENTPTEARFLTIGPSIGNILRFYGHRDSVALSVSSDPRNRNPAYVPIINPDLWLRQMGIHYIVWDFYSADRSAFYNASLMHYVRKYGGAIVYGIYQKPDGSLVTGTDRPEDAEPRIVVYDAIGGDPLDRAVFAPEPDTASLSPAHAGGFSSAYRNLP